MAELPGGNEFIDGAATLEVRVDNLIAISLYEKFGFEKVSIRKGYYDGVDGLLMKLELK